MACSSAWGQWSTTTPGSALAASQASGSTATAPSGVTKDWDAGTAIPHVNPVGGAQDEHAPDHVAAAGELGIGAGGHRAGVDVAGVGHRRPWGR